MGLIRSEIARRRKLVREGEWRFVWITPTYLFEEDDEGNLTYAHHPFTRPVAEDFGLIEERPYDVRAHAYDIVLNGYELGGGSLRIYDPAMQERVFEILGLDRQTIRDRFGYLLESFEYGVPPHGGIAWGIDRTVMMLVHGHDAYYYDLATRHQSVIDVFICYGQAMFDTLRRRLPERQASIVYLPYGIPLPAGARNASGGPLRVFYAGRLEHGQKGVLDLPAIDAVLAAAGTPVVWTIAGDGPDAVELRARWKHAARVRWLGVMDNAEVLDEVSRHDVFVLPTRSEGVPVAMIEAMGAGLVPIVSDIGGGVREVVSPGVHGMTPPVGDVMAFAEAIQTLHADRDLLERMSAAARARVAARYDIRERARAYQHLFARHHEFRRPRPARRHLPYGSRLDRRWLPNSAVKAIRSLARRSK
jgi:glycosyltransferase involved in cell wall biosynthesis